MSENQSLKIENAVSAFPIFESKKFKRQAIFSYSFISGKQN